MRTTLAILIVAMIASIATADQFLPTRDTWGYSTSLTATNGLSGTALRSNKGNGNPYWNVNGGYVLIDFDKPTVLSYVETQLGHPGVAPTLAEMANVQISLSIEGRNDNSLLGKHGVPAVVESTSTGWNEATCNYEYADSVALTPWTDLNGNVLGTATATDGVYAMWQAENAGLTGGMPRNATATLWNAINTYTTFPLDASVALTYLTNPKSIGLMFVTDGTTNIANNGGVFLRESGASTTPYLTVTVPEPATLSLLVIGGLAMIRRRN